jgi:hypothetical protein
MSTPEPADPWAEGNYGPYADPLPPDLADSIASSCAAQAAAADEPVPFTLTGQAEAALDAEPEPEAEAEAEAEAEWADEWDSEDSHVYMDRVEAGLEPEAEL